VELEIDVELDVDVDLTQREVVKVGVARLDAERGRLALVGAADGAEVATARAAAQTIPLLGRVLAGEALPVEAVVAPDRGLVGLEITKVVALRLLGRTLLRDVGRALEGVGVEETLDLYKQPYQVRPDGTGTTHGGSSASRHGRDEGEGLHDVGGFGVGLMVVEMERKKV